MRRFQEMHTLRNEALYNALYWSFAPIGKIALGLQVSGREHIPDQGAAIIAANHRHWSDVAALPYAVKKRHVTMVGRNDVTHSPLGLFIFNHGEVVQISREEFSRDDLRRMKERLQEERLLAIFPEGTRGDKSARKTNSRANLGEFKPGIAHFARLHDSPIVPTAISGLDHAFTRRHQRSGRVAFGEALEAPGRQPQSKEIFVAELRRRIEGLYEQTLEE